MEADEGEEDEEEEGAPVPILPKATNIVLQIFVTCTFYISLPFINMYILVGQDFLQSF
jgi:hypothetical protein